MRRKKIEWWPEKNCIFKERGLLWKLGNPSIPHKITNKSKVRGKLIHST